jgi:hypothetical protein
MPISCRKPSSTYYGPVGKDHSPPEIDRLVIISDAGCSRHYHDLCITAIHDQQGVRETRWRVSRCRTASNRRASTPALEAAAMLITVIEPSPRPLVLAPLRPSRLCGSAISAMRASCHLPCSTWRLPLSGWGMLRQGRPRTRSTSSPWSPPWSKAWCPILLPMQPLRNLGTALAIDQQQNAMVPPRCRASCVRRKAHQTSSRVTMVSVIVNIVQAFLPTLFALLYRTA